MAERQRRFWMWLLPKLIIFVAGVAVGFYARDQRYDDLREAYEEAATELEQLRTTGQDVIERSQDVIERSQEVIERGRRAGEAVKEAVTDSAQ